MKKCFTLIELLLVMAIIAILSGIIMIETRDYQAKFRDKKRMADISVIAQAIERYKGDHGFYPVMTFWNKGLNGKAGTAARENTDTYNCVPGSTNCPLTCNSTKSNCPTAPLNFPNDGNPNYGKNPTYTADHAFFNKCKVNLNGDPICAVGVGATGDYAGKSNRDVSTSPDSDYNTPAAFLVPPHALNQPPPNYLNQSYRMGDFYPYITIMPPNSDATLARDELTQKLEARWDGNGDGIVDANQTKYLDEVPWDPYTFFDFNGQIPDGVPSSTANEFRAGYYMGYRYASYIDCHGRGLSNGQGFYLFTTLEKKSAFGVLNNFPDNPLYYQGTDAAPTPQADQKYYFEVGTVNYHRSPSYLSSSEVGNCQ